MNIVGILLGGLLGFLLSKKVMAKSLGLKLIYVLLYPVLFDVVALSLLLIVTGNSYYAGYYGVPFILCSITFAIIVLIKMKVNKNL